MKYLRIKKQADFQRLFQKGKRAHSSSMTILYRSSDKMRMGISIGKKHGKSVQRNYIKRILRESFRSFTPKLRQNFFFVFIPKVKEEYSYEEYKKCMQYLFSKGGFLVDNA